MSLTRPMGLHCMNATTFTDVITVAVPVTDQDAAKSLFERLGFEVRSDSELQPGFRWIELGLTGGGTTISLVAAGDELPAGIDTGIRLMTADARDRPRERFASSASTPTSCSTGKRRR